MKSEESFTAQMTELNEQKKKITENYWVFLINTSLQDLGQYRLSYICYAKPAMLMNYDLTGAFSILNYGLRKNTSSYSLFIYEMRAYIAMDEMVVSQPGIITR